MKSYSQSGQDLFVYNIIGKNDGSFLDLGCSFATEINNTYLLELMGWKGVSLDIIDFSEDWKKRKNIFLQMDCTKINYNEFLNEYYTSTTIDYLTLDMEKPGDRYSVLKSIMNSNYDFKVITIEHDSYLGDEYIIKEKIPQRELLMSKGYHLLCSDVSQKEHPTLYFEDWWVNTKYFDIQNLSSWKFDKTSVDKIFESNKIIYEKI
jgi:hypothetical protein